jgi:hypothetical protein
LLPKDEGWYTKAVRVFVPVTVSVVNQEIPDEEESQSTISNDNQNDCIYQQQRKGYNKEQLL